MTEAQRERIKLKASYLNGLAVGLFIVGGLTQLTAALNLMFQDGSVALFWTSTAVSGVCFLASPVLHLWARSALGDLDQ